MMMLVVKFPDTEDETTVDAQLAELKQFLQAQVDEAQRRLYGRQLTQHDIDSMKPKQLQMHKRRMHAKLQQLNKETETPMVISRVRSKAPRSGKTNPT